MAIERIDVGQIDQQIVNPLFLREGEKFLGRLASGIVEVEDLYAVDTTPADQSSVMRAKATQIMALPESGRNVAFCALSPHLRTFSEKQATFWALEELYTLGQNRLPGKIEADDRGEASMWYKCFENARAVRERAMITRRLLTDAIYAQSFAHSGSSIEIVSIASGSASCVLEAMKTAEGQCIKVRARMLDRDPEALAYSKGLAKEMGLIAEDDQKIMFIDEDVVKINGIIKNRPVHVVEAVGIMDYLPDVLCLRPFLPKIHSLLAPGGILIASNITPNPEMGFLHTAVGWQNMQYRSSEEFSNLFIHSRVGFKPENCTVHRNPNGIYSIIEARKTV